MSRHPRLQDIRRVLLIGVIATACAPGTDATPLTAQHAHSAESASAQLDAVRAATGRFRDVDVARAEGYVRFGRSEGPLMGEHWYRKDAVKEALDLSRPSTLQYVTVNGERQLVGVAYTVYQRPGEPLPEGFAGSEDHWHVHDVTKLARAIAAERPVLKWFVERRAEKGKLGAGNGRSMLVMLHAWVWTDNPDGVFALQNRALPYLRAGLPAAWAERASEDAAWGIAIAAENGCSDEIARTHMLAKLSRSQKERLKGACATAAESVRLAFRTSKGAAPINHAAEVAWRTYATAKGAVLEPRQKARIASVIEHDPAAMGQHH